MLASSRSEMRLHQQCESARCADSRWCRERPADNIAHGVRWHEATSVALELGCELFLEASPEHVLTDLARDNLDRMQAWPVTPGDFQRLLKLAR